MNTHKSPDRPLVALIAGPTASGKSGLAIDLAERWHGTIINADASQVYRDLRVLTARPTANDEARVPHRLFGQIDGADSHSAAAWAADARAAIFDTLAAGRLPILVGGTGLYLRTLLDGIAPIPDIDPDIRAMVRSLPVDDAHRALADVDPEAAGRLRASDTSRVARALEVILSTRRPISEWQSDRIGGINDQIRLNALVLLPDRAWLTQRIDARLAAMFAGEARAEVAALLNRNDIPANAPVRRAIGVAEISTWIAGDLTETEALARARMATRQYAKRQYTWFRNQPPSDWIRTNAIDSNALINLFEIKLRT